jgi:hypothetical protein
MITNVRPMSVDHARCLAMAYELHRLLGNLFDRPEHGPGSSVEDAWNHMDDVIALLEPPDLDEKPTLRSLRLVEARKVRP